VHTRSVLRRAVGCALAFALALAGPAAADNVAAQARYYASFKHEQPIAAPAPQALYYASFRHEQPIRSPRADSGSHDWLVPGAGLVVVLLVGGGGAVALRRVRVRQRARVVV
jgi:hypothetical protein